jgi:hypothetical protein
MRELFNLYSRYGAAEFERAVEALESGSYTNVLLRTLRATEMAGASVNTRSAMGGPTKKKKQPKEYLAEFVSELSKSRTDESDRIADFVRGIAERRILQNAAVLREYARRLGLPVDGKMDRPTVARKIGEVILSQSSDARRNNVELASKMGAQGSSLQAWSDIIVKGSK